MQRYLVDAEQLADFLDATGMPTTASAITREHLEDFLVHLSQRPNTRRGGRLAPATVVRTYR